MRQRKNKTNDLLDDFKREIIKTGEYPKEVPQSLEWDVYGFFFSSEERKAFIEKEKS